MASDNSEDFIEQPGNVRLVHHNSTAIVCLRGDIDVNSRDELRVKLAEALAADRVIVDLSRARFIDSTTINALLVAHRAAQLAKVTLTIAPGPDNVMRTLRIAGVAELLGLARAPSENRH